jgi:hypothetical protein
MYLDLPGRHTVVGPAEDIASKIADAQPKANLGVLCMTRIGHVVL